MSERLKGEPAKRQPEAVSSAQRKRCEWTIRVPAPVSTERCEIALIGHVINRLSKDASEMVSIAYAGYGEADPGRLRPGCSERIGFVIRAPAIFAQFANALPIVIVKRIGERHSIRSLPHRPGDARPPDNAGTLIVLSTGAVNTCVTRAVRFALPDRPPTPEQRREREFCRT